MRLLATFNKEAEAKNFFYTLENKKIQASITLTKKDNNILYEVWVNEEDDLEKALNLYKSFQKDPTAPSTPPSTPPINKYSFNPIKSRPSSFPIFTYIIFFICILVYSINYYQASKYEKKHNIQTLITPIQYWLLYDEPVKLIKLNELIQKNKSTQTEEPIETSDEKNNGIGISDGVKHEVEISDEVKHEIELIQKDETIWEGFYFYLFTGKLNLMSKASLFNKIREGQIWRLITPIFLHASFFHLLFNMLWLLYLSKQLEERINVFKNLSLVLIIAIISNTCQYLMTGPLFCGYSGVVIGLIGFIWVRQKKASWEGYLIPHGIMLFVLFYIIALFILQFISLATQFNLAIANTAHISGGLTGILLGNTPFFSRSFSK